MNCSCHSNANFYLKSLIIDPVFQTLSSNERNWIGILHSVCGLEINFQESDLDQSKIVLCLMTINDLKLKLETLKSAPCDIVFALKFINLRKTALKLVLKIVMLKNFSRECASSSILPTLNKYLKLHGDIREVLKCSRVDDLQKFDV